MFLKPADFLLYFAWNLNHLDTGCLHPVDPCSCDNNCGTITYDTMHRSPGLLVLSIKRVQQQSSYEPEPRNWNCSWLQATRGQALVAYMALGNAVADVADSE